MSSRSGERQRLLTSNATGGGLPSETESRVAVEGHIRHHGERNQPRHYMSTMGSRMAGTQGVGSRAALHEDAESIKTVPVGGQHGLIVGRMGYQSTNYDEMTQPHLHRASIEAEMMKREPKGKKRAYHSPQRPSSRSRDKVKRGKLKKKAGTNAHSPSHVDTDSHSAASVTKRTKRAGADHYFEKSR